MTTTFQQLVFDAAERARQVMIDDGVKCGSIDYSINRHGEASCYFKALSGRFRISDHHANEDFRSASEIQIYYESATPAYMIALSRELRRRDKIATWRSHILLSKRDRYEAPFIARFKAAKEHEKHTILCEAYPNLKFDVHERRAVLARWRS